MNIIYKTKKRMERKNGEEEGYWIIFWNMNFAPKGKKIIYTKLFNIDSMNNSRQRKKLLIYFILLLFIEALGRIIIVGFDLLFVDVWTIVSQSHL